MDITFATGDSGFFEAFALVQIARLASERDPSDSDTIQLLDQLTRTGEAHCAKTEFAELRARTQESIVSGDDDGWWRGLFGPSRREVLLSEQRIEALERASRAERSSFEALAETARVARECDELKVRIAELEARLSAAGATPIEAGPQGAPPSTSK